MNKQLTIVVSCDGQKTSVNSIKLLFYQKIDCQIVVLNLSNDEITKQRLLDYQKQSHQVIKIVEENSKVEDYIKTPYVLFMKCDTIITDKNLLRRCIESMHRRSLDLVTVKLIAKNGYSKYYRIFEFFRDRVLSNFPTCTNSFMMYRSDVAKNNKIYDTCHDLDQSIKLSRAIDKNKFAVVKGKVATSEEVFKNYGKYYLTIKLFSNWIHR